MKKNNKTRRGYGKKNKKDKGYKNVGFSILGTNANGISGKQESLKSTVNHFIPSVITVQETKLTRMGLIKLKGYQVYEKIRSGGGGGGLLTAIDEDLYPVLISTGEDDQAELLTVQIKVGKYDIRVINAYGPQEDDSNLRRFNFWQELENEVISAKDNNCLIIIQMDANAKIGKDKIKNDPNEMSSNGKIMIEMIKRQGLIIGNCLNQCKGTITRERANLNNVEQAVLDYVVMCEGMKMFLDEMVIDEERVHVLTKYAGKRAKSKNKVSDHNIMFAKYKLTFNRLPVTVRKEFFNFKNKENQKIFFEETSNSFKLRSCFDESRSFAHNANIFFHTLRGTFHKSFKKIRITSGKSKLGEKTLQEMLQLKNELKIFLLNSKCQIGKIIAENKLKETEKYLTDNFAAKSAEIIKEQVQGMETLDGTFSQTGFWKVKKKLCPQTGDPPMAKFDENGMLVTSPRLLKDLYLRTYQHRLRQRIMKPEYQDIYFLKMELWESRLEELMNNKSAPWTEENLLKVIKSLKNNKTMDPMGMINEIFKPEVIGADLFSACLKLFNGSKSNLVIPEYLNLSNITSIWKLKGSKC